MAEAKVLTAVIQKNKKFQKNCLNVEKTRLVRIYLAADLQI